MRFIRRHWFAILFDILLWMIFISTSPLDGFTISIASFIVLIVVGIQIGYHRFKTSVKHFFNKDAVQKEHMDNEMKAHYQKQGLSEEETTFFRQTMAQTKQQILDLDEAMQQTSALSLVAEQTKVISAAKGVFKELVQEPKKLHMMSDFLYTYLPNALDLCQKYNEVYAHELKNEQTNEALNESLNTITHLCLAIVSEYNKITSDDLKELTDGIDLAQRRLNKQLNQKEMLK